MQKSTEIIEQGLREFIEETKIGNMDLIRRSEVFEVLEALIKNLKAHTQRRLTNKMQPNPDAHVAELFRRYTYLIRRIK